MPWPRSPASLGPTTRIGGSPHAGLDPESGRRALGRSVGGRRGPVRLRPLGIRQVSAPEAVTCEKGLEAPPRGYTTVRPTPSTTTGGRNAGLGLGSDHRLA